MTPDDLVLTPRGLRFRGQTIPCAIGRGGIRQDKSEGDGATPAGVHRIVGCLYRPDRMSRPCTWARAIRPTDGWSDDPADPLYNTLVRLPRAFCHERLFRADRLYDLVLVTDWNWPNARAGEGSAIFLHRWRRAGWPTAGCIATDPSNLLGLAERLQPGCRLIVPELAGRVR